LCTLERCFKFGVQSNLWCASGQTKFYRNSCVIHSFIYFFIHIYADELLRKLSKSGYGCHVGNTFFGCIMYADNLILLSPSFCALQYMIDICSDYATDHSLVFNVKKTVCTSVNRPKCSISGVPMDNDEINFTNYFKYLGVHLTVGSDISVDILPVRRKFFYSL